jgi:hypothetical protein
MFVLMQGEGYDKKLDLKFAVNISILPLTFREISDKMH